MEKLGDMGSVGREGKEGLWEAAMRCAVGSAAEEEPGNPRVQTRGSQRVVPVTGEPGDKVSSQSSCRWVLPIGSSTEAGRSGEDGVGGWSIPQAPSLVQGSYWSEMPPDSALTFLSPACPCRSLPLQAGSKIPGISLSLFPLLLQA